MFGDRGANCDHVLVAISYQRPDRDRGGQIPNVRGGELAPKVVLAKLGLSTPKLRIFYRNSAEKGQISGPPKIQSFHPPSNFRRFDPPYPGLQSYLQERYFKSIKHTIMKKLHAQYDWTTGVPDNGNDWRKFRVVPRLYPLRPLVFYFV